jgi:DNA-binding response OmpR family regulator
LPIEHGERSYREERSGDMKRFRVLIVDDDHNLVFLLRQRLENEGYRVESAHSATEGYLNYLAFRPDLVLTDIAMGEEDGLDLIRRIRRHAPTVKTIYMTGEPGRHETELNVECKNYHAGVLEKPFSGRQLLELISCSVHRERHVAA